MQCREKRHVLICKWIGTLLRIKVGTFKTSVRRAHANHATEKFLKDDHKHITKTLFDVNNYSHWVITKNFKETKKITQSAVAKQVKEAETTSIKNHMLVPPYKERKECILLIQWKGMSTKCCQKMLNYKQFIQETDVK